MKKSISILLPLLLLLVSTLDAMTFRDRGLYGNLSLSYVEDLYLDSGNLNAQERFIQEYKLGYRGNIYSPKLLDYTLETIFRYENLVNENGANSSESKIKSRDYMIDASFIQSTKIPFSVYYKTVERPTSFIYGNTVSKYTQKLESKGIFGRIDLDLFVFNYKSSYSDDIFDTDVSTNYVKRKNSELSVLKTEKNYNIKLAYTYLDQSTRSDIVNVSSKTVSEVYNKANLTYVWRISDTLRLRTYMNYFDSKYFLSESISVNAHLAWSPREKYSASISANTTSINQTINNTDTFGQNIKTQDTVTTSGISQAFSYHFTKNLNFTQAISYLNYESITSSGENTSLNLGLNYSLKLSDVTRINFYGSVSQRDSKLNVVDTNNTIGDEQSTAFSIQAGLSKQFEIAESRFSVNLRYLATKSSLDRDYDNSMLNVTLTSKFWKMISNNLVLNYSIDNSNYTSYNYTSNENISTSISRISASETINYNGRLGIKGNTLYSASVSYSQIDNNGIKVTRIIPRFNLGINYRFWQRLLFKISLGLYKDLTYDFTNYYGNTGLNYEIGKTAFSMNYTYNMTGFESNDEILSVEKSKFNVKIVRRF